MKTIRADLHIHTVLSPCASLDMSPDVILKMAIERQLDVIGITDHNSTKQCEVIRRMSEPLGIKVLCGAEITTKEEVHCLVFFDKEEELDEFQKYIDKHLPKVLNNPAKFGYQVIVNEHNEILEEEERLLIVGLQQTIDEVAKKTASLNGLFIPAHINKQRFSLISQLGFLPSDFIPDAIEVTPEISIAEITKQYKWLKNYSIIKSSDAHFPEQIGSVYTEMILERVDFNHIKMFLHQKP